MPPKNIQRTHLQQAFRSIFSSLKRSVMAAHGGWGLLTVDVPIEKIPDFRLAEAMWQHLTPSRLQKRATESEQ